MIVNDIDRPDVNGVKPKMQEICDLAKKELAGIVPYLNITTDDNLCSNVSIQGSFDPKDSWENGIFHNGRYFIIFIHAEKKRYYVPGEG
jgi:hypothetical protein